MQGLKINKIYLEDNRIGMKKIQPGTVDLLITDPPFGINFHKVGSQYNRKQKQLGLNYIEVVTDYYDFTLEWLKLAYRCLKPTGSGFIFSGWNNLRDILNAIDETGFRLVNHCIWKYQFGVFTKKRFVNSHYHVLYITKVPKSKDKLRTFNTTTYGDMQDVWFIKRDYQRGGDKTPTRLPLAVTDKCVLFGSNENDLVLDPFIGSGSVAISCINHNRNFIGFELSPPIYEVAQKRIQKAFENLNSIKQAKNNKLEKYIKKKK